MDRACPCPSPPVEICRAHGPIPCIPVQDICQDFIFLDQELDEVMQLLNKDIDEGLTLDGNENACVKCFPTYVQDLPNGTETGKFLALDLGGTNFRVLLITLSEEENASEQISEIYEVPPEIMVGTGEELFDHVASSLYTFMETNELLNMDPPLPLGFTFSFPLEQRGLSRGILISWTKGFDCPDVVGRDVVQMLKDSIEKHDGLKINVYAVCNDTTGTLVSCAYVKNNCKVGIIMGTGCNGCYLEDQTKVELWRGKDHGSGKMIVNTEWGAFGDDGCLDCIRTEFDDIIDADSINPGKQTFEKLVSGMYLGEQVRLVLLKLVSLGLIFRGKCSEQLCTKNSITAKFLSKVHTDPAGVYVNLKSALKKLGFRFPSDMDLINIRFVCDVVIKRSTGLLAAGIACLLNRVDEDCVTVAIDGSVFRFHPTYRRLLAKRIYRLKNDNVKFKLMLSEDGSGRGAALVAAVVDRVGEDTDCDVCPACEPSLANRKNSKSNNVIIQK